MRYVTRQSYEPTVITAAAAAALLAIPLFLGWPGQNMAAEMTITNKGTPATTAQSSAKASASASSSSSVSVGKDGTKCHAKSSSSAEAQAGDDYASDKDEDVKTSETGDCSAKAESRASAKSGQEDQN